MMGKSHAISGAAGWVTGCAALTVVGVHPASGVVWAGAAVSAGAALLPDLDHPESTAARTLGPLTWLVHAVTVRAARLTQQASCAHCAHTPAGGHRGLTHTAVGAVVAGGTVAAAVAWFGPTVGLWIAVVCVWLMTHTALTSKTRAHIGDMLLPGKFRRLGKVPFRIAGVVGAALIGLAAAGVMRDNITGWWWLGVAVGWGCLAHSLGDALTFSKVPLLWPVRIRGCRWSRVGAPDWMRFRTGSRTETVVVILMALAGVGALALLGAGR